MTKTTLKRCLLRIGPCTTNNGGCNQFCWTSSSNTRVCDCAPGFLLASDGETCTSRKSYININFKKWTSV